MTVLAARTWGDAAAPLAVLLHGVGGGQAAWDGVGPALAAAGWRVAAVDLPGYGASAPAALLPVEAMAQAVHAFVRHAGHTRALLVGHSMGGMVAQTLAATAPEAARALVLVSTSPAFGPSDGAWQRDFLASRFAPLDAGQGMAALARALVPSMLGPAAEPGAAAAATALMATVPEATYRAALTALVAFDRRADLGRIAVPTLVVTGEHDRTAPPAVAQRMAARIPGAACRILPGAGHLAPLEQPAAFAAVLRAFVESIR